MRLNDIIGMAFYNLWRRKLRTFLTTLAVVIGAMLVALMMSLGNGVQTFIERQFGTIFPKDAITVYSGASIFAFQGSIPREITNENEMLFRAFTSQDYQKLKAIPGVERIGFLMSLVVNSIQPEGSDKKYTVLANPAADYEIVLRPLLAGSYYDVDASGVCLLNYDYAEAFGWKNPQEALGKELTLTVGKQSLYDTETRDYSFRVVGVLEKTSTIAEVMIPPIDAIEMGRFSYDDPKFFTEEKPGYALQLKILDVSQVDTVAQVVKDMGFQVLTANEVLARLNTIFAVVQAAMSVFGGIALVVAAIGIINTLMMAIHERTREIGVMKATGATRGAIRIMFTVEGGILGLAGGISGVLVAILVGQLLNFIGSRTLLADFPGFTLSVFPLELILGVVLLTTTISLLAGLYPASRAASLDPVDALRYE
jgi:putative ABC transport system permease protein